jgi:serine/threonine protein kinase/tetratricopeptide (TPR) repeat protein
VPSPFIQRQIDELLEEAARAIRASKWTEVTILSRSILVLDPMNSDAPELLLAAERANPTPNTPASTQIDDRRAPQVSTPNHVLPQSFSQGRYQVKRFLGEGGKKRVFLAHDTLLDREVAFALIKTEGLDKVARERITREAQAMGHLGAHPHIVTVFDLGEEDGQPFIVTELMGGGDVEGLIEKAPEHRPPLERTLEIGVEVCRGLEFAHSHGIVHRDLKPGNVWLTADGTAKLGDFGLAVALDKTRLTQAGMMVGTVSYMPPEQAIGGKVTPRSDLYSLGAMLYEMVTGRPPFVGDESVAIISQHLNAQPVAPSWHNANVPSSLEALILRLLDKDPQNRPESAVEVRVALERVGAVTSPTQSEPVDVATADNPMYRRTFVGREPELRQLQAAFDSAASGQGSLAVVIGEPGIGKTSICEQLATYATIRGGKTLIGHCYEEGSLSLPYLPFIEAMRSYALASEPDGLRKDLGSGADEVARIVSEIRERLHVEPSPANPADAEEERYRLFQAVAGFLRNAAMVQPLVIVLEDLHDADRGTLDLLVHLARNLGGTRLMVIGTYRDVEVDRAHPLSGTLAELRRGSNVTRVLLRGLTADEVQRMMNQLSGQEVPWRLAEAVHRQTEGNPLFIQEVLRYLVEEGLIKREEGRWRRASEDTPLELGIPEGLRDVIGKRLSRLSPETNTVLATAAIMGREFRLDVLERVAGQDDEDLDAALAEARAIAVVEERTAPGGTVSYRFTHAFFRQTLYEETIAPKRIRLHQQVARALEAVYGRRLEEHAAELAEHYAYSSDPADLGKAVEYGELAARRAMGVFAYGEAARHLEQALKVQEVLDPDDKARHCDLLLPLGDALLLADEPNRVLESIAPEVLRIARELGSDERASRSCRLALYALTNLYGVTAWTTPKFGHWAEEADRLAAPGSVDRVLADGALAGIAYFANEPTKAWALLERALDLAKQLGGVQSISIAPASMQMSLSWLPEHQERRLLVALEYSTFQQGGTGDRAYGALLDGSIRALLAWGERARAEEVLVRLRELADRSGDSHLWLRGVEHEAYLRAIDGRLEDAVKLSERMRDRMHELGLVPDASFYVSIWPLLHLGRSSQALDGMRPERRAAAESGRSITFAAELALILALEERWPEVQGLLEQLRARWDASTNSFNLNVSPLVLFLAVTVRSGDTDMAAKLRRSLASIPRLVADRYPTLIARHLGDASASLGESEQAHRYYEEALDVGSKICFRPELALTHQSIAELLLLAKGKHTEALRHLDIAIGEFREMKMQPSLERALRHKEVLKA